MPSYSIKAEMASFSPEQHFFFRINYLQPRLTLVQDPRLKYLDMDLSVWLSRGLKVLNSTTPLETSNGG